MSSWFIFNTILFFIASWQLISHPLFPVLPLHMTVGFIGFLFFLFNWTRNAVFASIRNVPKRQTKIKLANLSKKVMPFHRWTGTTALLFILGHALLIIINYGFTLKSPKMIFGLISLLIMIALVTSGWLRLVKPTGKLRRVHLGLAMSLFFSITIHLLL